MTGPFETAKQASDAAQAAGLGPVAANEAAIRRALGDHALYGAGAYDYTIIDWLAAADGPTVAVVCSLIERATEARPTP